jgi:hypothetical protein
MKRLIVADEYGTIIGSGPHPDDGRDPNLNFGFLPLEGQSIHEVDLPSDIQNLKQLVDLHTTHTVKVDRGRAYLVERAKSR